MKPVEQDFAGTYRHLPNEDIAALFADRQSLTGEASSALDAEIARRGLGEAQLARLHAAERRNEAKFDRRERKRRKMVAILLLPPRWRIRLMLAGLALAAVIWLYDWLTPHH